MVLMGHYITDGSDCFSKMYGLQLNQLLSLTNMYNKDEISIIFDDGLKCHLNAAKLMIQRGYNVSCAIPECIIDGKEFLDVHKSHICIAKMTEKEIKNTIDKNFNYEEIELVIQNKNIYQHQNSSLCEKVFKYLVNYSDHDFKDTLNETFTKYNDISFSDFYLNETDLIDLYNEGVSILPHGSKHVNLATLSKISINSLYEEIKKSINFSRKYNYTNSFVLPYGTPNSVNDLVIKALEKESIEKIYIAKNNNSSFDVLKPELLYSRTDIGFFFK